MEEKTIKTSTKGISFWDGTISKGLRAVYFTQQKKAAKDEVRIRYSRDVMLAVIFGTYHQDAEEFKKEMASIDKSFQGTGYSRDDKGNYTYTSEDWDKIEYVKQNSI